MKCQPLEINKGVPLGPMLNVIFKPIDYHMQKVRLISEIINKILIFENNYVNLRQDSFL